MNIEREEFKNRGEKRRKPRSNTSMKTNVIPYNINNYNISEVLNKKQIDIVTSTPLPSKRKLYQNTTLKDYMNINSNINNDQNNELKLPPIIN